MTAAAATAATAAQWPAHRNMELIRYINLKLAALGQPTSREHGGSGVSGDRRSAAAQLLPEGPVAGRPAVSGGHAHPGVPGWLPGDVCPDGAARLPADTFVLDRPGMARMMSLPATADSFFIALSELLSRAAGRAAQSEERPAHHARVVPYRRGRPAGAGRQNRGAEAGFRGAVGGGAASAGSMLALPFTADQDEHVRCFVSLLLRPLVCPATGRDPEKTMEIRFFAPASLVSNLDFVESIFGNAGDPYLPENDAALDVLHWTGHTGCVILAPHLVGIKKKDVGLPHISEATERQRRDGMCWENEDELYNDGGAFKVTCRDQRGVMVTIIADNYYGYCKKEVKTQISFAANLYGLCEEEHAGGAIAFATYVLGQEFYADRTVSLKKAPTTDAMRLLGDLVERAPEGYASTGASRTSITCRKTRRSTCGKAPSRGGRAIAISS